MRIRTPGKDRLALLLLAQRTLRATRRALARLGTPVPPMKMRFSRSSQFRFDLEIRRNANHLEIDYADPFPLQGSSILRDRLATVVHFMVHCPEQVNEISINLGDGDLQSKTGFAFCGNDASRGLLPDICFVKTNGFAHLRKVADTANHPWSQRKATLRWRGTDTGFGRKVFGPEVAFDPTVNARIRMCTIADTLPDTDCRFAGTEKSTDRPMFAHFGMIAAPIAEADWINDRYAIDVDGHTNTWSNMIARMHLGCCILKVGSQFGFRQWYYDGLKAGIHYVPVKPDMSDLGEKLQWVRANPGEAEKIAASGQAFVRSMTLESETQRAVETILRAVAAG